MPPQETCQVEIKNQKLEDYPEEELNYGQKLANPSPGDEVVITGVAGNFPNSRNVREFQSNLYNGVDMVSDDDRRWSLDHPEIPKRLGLLYDIEKFDPGYFGIHHRQADSADPMVRMLLERAVEAVMDAGINPSELEGTNTGVFVGSCISETQITTFTKDCDPQSFPVTGNHKTMLAHWISYYLKLKGPSIAVDTACSSSLFALEHAYTAIRDGSCDCAIVGGTNLCLHPFVSLQFARLGILTPDGSCKSFDADGNGYARAEAIVAVFLQKSQNAKRIYARIVHAKTNCDGYKEKGITFPSSSGQKQLFQDFYKECNVDPKLLSYMEAHGTGTKVGDPQEANAIDSILCKGRKTPLLIGAVKSNMGHSEPPAGLCSIIKVIIGAENGLIPHNLHFSKIREDIKALVKGSLKVVTKPTPLEDHQGLFGKEISVPKMTLLRLDLEGINSFGFGGANAHVLLEWNQKQKTTHVQVTDWLPRLVCVSGRIESSITSFLDDIKKRTFDVEYIALLNNLFRQAIKNHLYRGYSIISESGERSRCQHFFAGRKRSLYLVFSDFGDSWTFIANHFKVVPLFATSVQKVLKVLKTKDFELSTLASKGSNRGIINKMIGNLTVQIAIADIVKNLKLEPDGFFGQGVSELVCGYFDGTLSLEETVLSTYQIAKTLENVDQNSKNHKTFKEIELQLQKIISKIILEPKPRGRKWLSSSKTILASAEHFVNFLNVELSSKNLHDNVKENSMIVQIGNGQFKVSNKKIKWLRLENVENKTSFVSFLEILASLYNCGYNPQIAELYPKVQFPVSRGTPMIAPLIKWDHSKDWFVIRYAKEEGFKNGVTSFKFDLKDDACKWLGDYVIDGRNLFPAIGYLYLVWELKSMVVGMMTNEMNVVFENCKFLKKTRLTEDITVLDVMIQKGSGNFEVCENGVAVCTGQIYIVNKDSSERLSLPLPKEDDDQLVMDTEDIYKELRLRGYHHKGTFRGLRQCNITATRGFIQWDQNWTSFIDNMLQMKILQSDTRCLYLPTGIQYLSIKAQKHLSYVKKLGESPNFSDNNLIRCGGIEIRGLTTASIRRRKHRGEPILDKYEFVPNFTKLKLEEAIRVNIQLMIENLPNVKFTIVEIIDEVTIKDSEPLATMILETFRDLPLITAEITILCKQPLEIPNVTVEKKTLAEKTDLTLTIGTNLLQRATMLHQALGAIKDNGFILSRESLNNLESCKAAGLEILTVYTTETEKLVLFAKHVQLQPPTVIDVTDKTLEFKWLPALQKSHSNRENIVIVAQNKPLAGILGLINCIRKEPDGSTVKCFFILGNAPPFDLSNPFYSEQLAKNLAINIYKNSQWGTYRHLPLEPQMEIESEHCFVNVTQRGDFSSLKWIQGPLTNKTLLRPEEELVHVYYSAVNFIDAVTAHGGFNPDVVTKDRIQQDCVQGFEFSGRTINGTRCFGIVTGGALSTLVKADKDLLWKLPDHFSLEDGATIPVVYATVLHAFFSVTDIRKGSSILIHCGSGGIGQAAITIALHYGLTVYTTVGTQEKRNFIKDNFPQLKDHQIGNTRDTSFETMIRQQTHGRGVDFVLNSLVDEKVETSIRCLAHGGKFLELRKLDLVNNQNLQLLLIEREASFHGIVMDDIFRDVEKKKYLRKLIQEGLDNKLIKPLVRTVFKEDEVETAFRFIAGKTHIGKVLIKIKKEEKEKLIPPSIKRTKGVARYNCDPEKVYVIVGGLGGFGLELTDWLVLRGARKIVVVSRKGVRTGYQLYRIRIWKSYGTTVTISTADITSKKGCEELLNEANSLGKVEAIFNLAAVLRDAILENQTIATFKEVLEPKAVITKNLDQVSRTLCPSLSDFVVFSSVTCGRGHAGQANYGMANSIMERICEQRKQEGFSALAIEWAAIGQVGMVTKMQQNDVEIEIEGTLPQPITSCLQLMDRFLKEETTIVCSMILAEKKQHGVKAHNIVDAVADIIGIRNLKTVSPHSTLPELGLDSMSIVEIQRTLEKEFNLSMTRHDLRKITFSRLQKIQEEKFSETGRNNDKDDPIVDGGQP